MSADRKHTKKDTGDKYTGKCCFGAPVLPRFRANIIWRSNMNRGPCVQQGRRGSTQESLWDILVVFGAQKNSCPCLFRACCASVRMRLLCAARVCARVLARQDEPATTRAAWARRRDWACRRPPAGSQGRAESRSAGVGKNTLGNAASVLPCKSHLALQRE